MTTEPKKALPRGVYLLSATEMWERMSYYGMRALLVLYMKAETDKGGFGWSKEHALSIYGWYTGAVYLTPLIGGFVADRLLGQRRAILIGGFLMMAGHFLMAVPGTTAFFSALALLVLGNGFFKPNISATVGGLFQPGDARRDSAYTVFYMGVNVGAALAPMVCGTLGEKVGFHWGFGSAGVGMLIGLVLFVVGAPKLLGDVGKAPVKGRENAIEQASDDDPKQVRERLQVIATLAVCTILFWIAFEQAGGLLTIFTDEKVDRHLWGWQVPTSWFQVINPVFIVILGPAMSWLWAFLGARGKDPSTATKMALGLALTAVGFALLFVASLGTTPTSKTHIGWVVASYFFQTLGELCLSPVGLSMISKLAPARYVSLMMGVWYGCIAIANKLAGVVGAYSVKAGDTAVFAAIAVSLTLMVGVLNRLTPTLNRWSHGRG